MIFFETERLIVKTVEEKDYHYFVELLSDPRIIEPIPQPIFSEEIILEKFNKSIAANEFVREPFAAGVFRKRALEGMIGLSLFLVNQTNALELGYRFRVGYWRQGYGTELTQGILSYYFDTLKEQEVTADVNISNIGSVRILQKFMEPVKEFFNPRDNCVDRRYRITSEMWAINNK